MPKHIDRQRRQDKNGFWWTVDERSTKWYPAPAEDKIHILVLRDALGTTTYVKYDEAGKHIAGDKYLA